VGVTTHMPEWTGLDLWYITDNVEGQLLVAAIQVNPDDQLESRQLAFAATARRIGRIMYDPFIGKRLVECDGQLVPMSVYASYLDTRKVRKTGSDQRSNATMQPTSLFDQAVAMFQMTPKQVQLSHAYWNAASNTVKLFSAAPSITGTSHAIKSPAVYSASIDLTSSTHHCSCRSIKANQIKTPCVHAVALLIALDMGQAVQTRMVQQPKAPKAPKPAKPTIASLQAELARVQAELEATRASGTSAQVNLEDQDNRLANLQTQVDLLTYDKTVLNEEKEILAKEVAEATEQIATLTGSLEEAQRFIADMSTYAVLHQQPKQAELLDGLGVVMAHISSKDPLTSIVCNEFERLLN
jgi:hypothetical protein